MSSYEQIATGSWPAHLAPGAVRWARSSRHYEQTIAFYRDSVGLPVVEQFNASYGEDGTLFGLPGTAVHIEIVRAHRTDDVGASGDDQLVLYLPDAAAVKTATTALRRSGLSPDPDPPAYWAANGAVVYHDPDGRRVIYAPWVYGRDVEQLHRLGV